MDERRGVYRVLVGKPEGKRPLRIPKHRWDYLLRSIFSKWGVEVWTGLSWLGMGTGGGRLRMPEDGCIKRAVTCRSYDLLNYIYIINVLLDCAITYILLITENTTLIPHLKVCHPHCVRSIIQAVVCLYLYIHTVMNTKVLHLVAIYY